MDRGAGVRPAISLPNGFRETGAFLNVVQSPPYLATRLRTTRHWESPDDILHSSARFPPGSAPDMTTTQNFKPPSAPPATAPANAGSVAARSELANTRCREW